MKLVESILTQNPCYTAGRKIEVKGLMLHSVGCAQPNAQVFIRSWNTPEHDNSSIWVRMMRGHIFLAVMKLLGMAVRILKAITMLQGAWEVIIFTI